MMMPSLMGCSVLLLALFDSGGMPTGIDPSVRSTGYGVIESARANVRLVEAGIVAPRNGATLEQRLC